MKPMKKLIQIFHQILPYSFCREYSILVNVVRGLEFLNISYSNMR